MIKVKKNYGNLNKYECTYAYIGQVCMGGYTKKGKHMIAMVVCIKTWSKIKKRNGIAKPHMYILFYVLSRYIKIVNCDNNIHR